MSPKLRVLLTRARALGIHTTVDFDDLIFDVNKAEQAPIVINQFANIEQVRQSFKRHAEAVTLFDEMTVSTLALADAARRCFPELPVHVVRNGLSNFWLQHADRQLERSVKQPNDDNDLQRLTYLPGTRGHDGDFRQVQDTLRVWLEQESQRRLCIVGNMNLDSTWHQHPQLERWPLMDYFALPAWIQRSQITIAPLIDNLFNNAKSHIKYLESAAFGVPVVCSPNSDLLDHDAPMGLHLAQSDEQWLKALGELSTITGEPETREAIRTDVRTRCSASTFSAACIARWEAHTCSRSLPHRAQQSPSTHSSI